MEPVVVSVMNGGVELKGMPSGNGCDYFLSVAHRAIVNTKTPDPNPPSNEGLAAYFTTAETRIMKALYAHFANDGQVEEIVAGLKEQIRLLKGE